MPSPTVQSIAAPKNKGGRPRKVSPPLEPIEHKLLTRKGVPRSLANFVEKMLKLYAPHMLPMLMEETRKAMSSGDKDALERAAKMFGLIGNKGIAINVNAQAGASANSSPSSSDRVGFESVIRKMNAEKSTIDVKAG